MARVLLAARKRSAQHSGNGLCHGEDESRIMPRVLGGLLAGATGNPVPCTD